MNAYMHSLTYAYVRLLCCAQKWRKNSPSMHLKSFECHRDAQYRFMLLTLFSICDAFPFSYSHRFFSLSLSVWCVYFFLHFPFAKFLSENMYSCNNIGMNWYLKCKRKSGKKTKRLCAKHDGNNNNNALTAIKHQVVWMYDLKRHSNMLEAGLSVIITKTTRRHYHFFPASAQSLFNSSYFCCCRSHVQRIVLPIYLTNW